MNSFSRLAVTMRARFEGVLLGILFAALGAWMSLVGAGIIRPVMADFSGAGLVISGLIFFFAGAWAFFRSTIGPWGRNSPFYRWVEYFMVLPILAGFGALLILSGSESDEWTLIALGVVPLLGALWYAFARFPRRGGKM